MLSSVEPPLLAIGDSRSCALLLIAEGVELHLELVDLLLQVEILLEERVLVLARLLVHLQDIQLALRVVELHLPVTVLLALGFELRLRLLESQREGLHLLVDLLELLEPFLLIALPLDLLRTCSEGLI